MANRNSRLNYSRSRVRSQQRRTLILAGIALAVVALIVILAVAFGRGGRDRAVPATQATAAPTPAPTEEVAAEPTPEPTPAERTPEQRAQTRPTATAAGFAPVFMSSDTDEKIIAITVDDCYQANNLEKIVNAAIEVGGKLTIFPIGQNALREKQAKVLKYAWENGFELENHTFTHNGLYRSSDQELTEEIYKQQLALSYILGVEYQPHFLRPRGGDARKDQRLQNYAMQLGYYGIAHWSASGTAGRQSIANHLKPGAIYLFHTTDKDWDKLKDFIPWVVSKGYRLVTLNEMFGYPANETSPLTTPISQHTIPPLQPYERVYTPLKNTTYSYYAYLLQAKLKQLGYLKGDPDGVYGDACEKAVKAYQKDHKLKVTGIADAELQQALLGS